MDDFIKWSLNRIETKNKKMTISKVIAVKQQEVDFISRYFLESRVLISQPLINDANAEKLERGAKAVKLAGWGVIRQCFERICLVSHYFQSLAGFIAIECVPSLLCRHC